MTTADPGPDLTGYDTVPPDAYEWFLSDHPWAAAERRRRHAEYYGRARQNAADVLAWADKVVALGPTGDRSFDPAARGLAAMIRPHADKAHLRNEMASAVPDDVDVLELRHQFENHRHADGEYGYSYPAHLTGAGAAAYPPPASGFPARLDRDVSGTREHPEA